jgi:hypothetical protein
MDFLKKLSKIFPHKKTDAPEAPTPPENTEGVDFLAKLTGHKWTRIDDVIGGTSYAIERGNATLKDNEFLDLQAMAQELNTKLQEIIPEANKSEDLDRFFHGSNKELVISAYALSAFMKIEPDLNQTPDIAATAQALHEIMRTDSDRFIRTKKPTMQQVVQGQIKL